MCLKSQCICIYYGSPLAAVQSCGQVPTKIGSEQGSTIGSLYNFKNITMHSQISQDIVCPQAPTPPLPHIYSTKCMCMCVASQSPLFHKVFFIKFFSI